MRIAIIGGKLQGLEAAYLAKKSHIETLLIDKHHTVPAKGLCDEFLQFEFGKEPSHPLFSGKLPDIILPACENPKTLAAVKQWADAINIPLATDLEAFTLSSSKRRSNTIFAKLNIPAPLPWPECGYPAVIKPDNSSGSKGVNIIRNESELFLQTELQSSSPVLQEYLEGPSYSIEIIGRPGHYQVLQVTDLYMDKRYDCKRISAPTSLPATQIKVFENMALRIAEKICLKGIMDVEVILNRGQLKILEIDARLPSQTPITVFWSTGINMVTELVKLFTHADNSPLLIHNEKHIALEHISVSTNQLEVCGEHILADCGPLQIIKKFFGADEAITNYQPDSSEWVATLLFKGSSHEAVRSKRYNCYNRIKNRNFQIVPNSYVSNGGCVDSINF